MSLSQDIHLDEAAFTTASSNMKALKTRAEALKTKLQQMYIDLTKAIDTPAGAAVEQTAESVVLQPIDDLILVIDHISSTLSEIIATGNYKDVFTKFEELHTNINFEN